MKNWEMPVMEELMIEETACDEECYEVNMNNPCKHGKTHDLKKIVEEES